MIEVKATLAAQGFPAKIASLEQLDDSLHQPLFLAGARLHQMETGQNLVNFVDAVRHFAKGDAEAARLLSDRLIAAGFIDAHIERYPRRFVVAEIRMIEVSGSFPRLTSGTVPLGIMRAMYEIDLDKAIGNCVSVENALRKLGAI